MKKEDIIALGDLNEFFTNYHIMRNKIITDNGYSVEQSISGYWRLMKDGEIIYDDSACEDVNGDKETAVAFLPSIYMKPLTLQRICKIKLL